MVVSMADLKASLSDAAPSATLSAACRALVGRQGQLGHGDKIVMNEETSEAAWVHADLHRVEGDLGNAGYWYRQAGQPAARDLLKPNGRASQPRSAEEARHDGNQRQA